MQLTENIRVVSNRVVLLAEYITWERLVILVEWNESSLSNGTNVAETTCRARGCWWQEVYPRSISWCFRPKSCGVPDIARGDCHPDPVASPTTCATRGRCWMRSNAAAASWCFYPADYKGYTIGNITETSIGKSVRLSRALSSASLPFPKPLSELKVDVQEETETRIRMKASNLSL
ncbi:GAA [Mytilus coruscus]|uniref:GAA n=1 Tax=Mytilus coruscus TaxID=42192 RepID=A0A6J8C653_MYTCO|nr:GAA [Mytilus coruscus]